MHKTEPKIVAPGYTDEEIYEWMTKKLAAINQLREVLSYRRNNRLLKKTGSGNHGFITGCYFRYCADKLGSHSFSSKSSK